MRGASSARIIGGYPKVITAVVGGKTNLEYLRDLENMDPNKGSHESRWVYPEAGKIVAKMLTTPTRTTITLVIVKAEHVLGPTQDNTWRIVLGMARERGLHLCPPEVGPALLLQYPDLIPVGYDARIGMEPFKDISGVDKVLLLQRYSGGLKLFVQRNVSDFTMIDDLWVFVKTPCELIKIPPTS